MDENPAGKVTGGSEGRDEKLFGGNNLRSKKYNKVKL